MPTGCWHEKRPALCRLLQAQSPHTCGSSDLHIIRRFTQSWRNDYVAIEQLSRAIMRGHYVALLGLHKQHKRFAAERDNQIEICRQQGMGLRIVRELRFKAMRDCQGAGM